MLHQAEEQFGETIGNYRQYFRMQEVAEGLSAEDCTFSFGSIDQGRFILGRFVNTILMLLY